MYYQELEDHIVGSSKGHFEKEKIILQTVLSSYFMAYFKEGVCGSVTRVGDAGESILALFTDERGTTKLTWRNIFSKKSSFLDLDLEIKRYNMNGSLIEDNQHKERMIQYGFLCGVVATNHDMYASRVDVARLNLEQYMFIKLVQAIKVEAFFNRKDALRDTYDSFKSEGFERYASTRSDKTEVFDTLGYIDHLLRLVETNDEIGVHVNSKRYEARAQGVLDSVIRAKAKSVEFQL